MPFHELVVLGHMMRHANNDRECRPPGQKLRVSDKCKGYGRKKVMWRCAMFGKNVVRCLRHCLRLLSLPYRLGGAG